MKFNGRILVIGLGAVSRCTLPLLFKHLEMDKKKITVMDYADVGDAVHAVTDGGAKFVKDKIVKSRMGAQFAKHVGKGDLIIDLAWNIGCNDILQWCHDNGVMYVNTSVELWDPYEDFDKKKPNDRTLYVRHMEMRKMMDGWKNKKGATAVVDHGANPGLVSHFTKEALETMGAQWLEDFKKKGERREKIETALKKKQYNHLAHQLGVKTIHISERDTQVSDKPKEVNEFVNTWSIEGFYEEGTAPAEMGWGTHEKKLPANAFVHKYGPGNQICLGQYGIRTWVRSWVPCGEIVGMVVRHGEAFSISEYLTVMDGNRPEYRPTVHYAYCPCDAAINSLHELYMRNYEIQPRLRIMNDEITSGRDELGCLLMGHDYKSWWIGSLLDINETRNLVPGQNATTLQVAASLLGAIMWMIENPTEGVKLPDHLPWRYVMKYAKPYLGPMFNQAVDWSPLKNWIPAGRFGERRPPDEDMWQFDTFVARGT